MIDKYAIYKNKNVLITGSSGFFGGHLTDSLCRCNASVSVISRNSPPDTSGISYYIGDIKDRVFVDACVKEVSPNYIFHLAAHKDRSSEVELFPISLETNLIGTLNLFLSAINSFELESIVIAGTADEYGSITAPFVEGATEHPASAYAYSKSCVTKLSEIFAKFHGLPSVVLRPTLIYGPGQDVDMFLPALAKTLINDQCFPMTLGEQTRDFLYVEDLVNAFMMAALNKTAHGQVLNVGSGNSIRISEVALKVQNLLGKNGLVQLGEIDYRPEEIMEYSVDTSKIQSVLNWKSETNFDDGLRKTIDYYSV